MKHENHTGLLDISFNTDQQQGQQRIFVQCFPLVISQTRNVLF